MILKFEPTVRTLDFQLEKNKTWYIYKPNVGLNQKWKSIPDILKFIEQQCSSSQPKTQ